MQINAVTREKKKSSPVGPKTKDRTQLSKDYVRVLNKTGFVWCLYTPVSTSVSELEGMCAPEGGILFSFLFLTMYLSWSLCTLYLLAFQVRVTVGDASVCCCACMTSFERCIAPFFVDFNQCRIKRHKGLKERLFWSENTKLARIFWVDQHVWG